VSNLQQLLVIGDLQLAKLCQVMGSASNKKKLSFKVFYKVIALFKLLKFWQLFETHFVNLNSHLSCQLPYLQILVLHILIKVLTPFLAPSASSQLPTASC